MKAKVSTTLIGVVTFLLGVFVGGYLFSDTQPRSVLAFGRCENCLNRNELIGLVASVGIQRTPNLVPNVVIESEKTIVIQHPAPSAPKHFVIIPKRDIKNIGKLSEEDAETLKDMMALTQSLIQNNKMRQYRLWTNGPEDQLVAYLHFHLAGQ